MAQIPAYPPPQRDLADGDVVLASVGGKTVAAPVEKIAAYVVAKGGGGGGGGGSSSGQFVA